MNKINFLLFILFSAFFASCQKDKEPVIVYDIPDEFNIEIFQELGSSSNLYLKVTTLDEYPDNYRIEAAATKIDGKIEVNIYQIFKPTTPSNQQTTLSQKIQIDNLADGTYPLDLIIRNTVVNEGAITVSPSKIGLDFSTKYGISAKHYEVNRIAANGYWGFAYVESAAHIIYVDQFVQKIKAVSTEIPNAKVGNYGYFSISDQNKVELPLSQDNQKTFYMKSDDFDTINSYIQEYKSYGIGFHAVVLTAQGQVFHHVSYDPPAPSINLSVQK